MLFIPATFMAQDTLIFDATYIPYPDTTLVYEPNGYERSGEKYPAVILLHSYGENYSQWSNIANLQKLANEYQFLIVCPDGFYNSWYIDQPLKPQVQYEKFFTEDLLGSFLRTYRVDESELFITGMSMGGHGAMTLFLKNPDMFLSAGSTSGILDITAFPERWEIKRGLGKLENNIARWKKHSAYHLLDNLKGENKTFIMDCGVSDFAFPINEKFAKKAKKLGLDFKFIEQRGGHTHAYWNQSLKQHLSFFKKLTKQEMSKKDY
jgi:S-formylglutathione hydrolase FrmB